MTRVLFVCGSARPGGAERVMLSLVHALRERRYEPAVVLLEDGVLAEWLEESDVATTLIDAGRTRQVHRTASATAQLVRLLGTTRPAAVISNMSKAHVYAGIAAAARRVPAIWWQHSIPHRTRFDLAAARVPASAVVCVTDAAARAQRRLTPRRHVVTINPGVPIEKIQAARGTGARVRAELGWESNRLVGLVARLEPWKGHETFLRAAALVTETHPDVRFPLVGGALMGREGDYPQRMEALAEELGIAGRVHFAGHQPDPWAWMDALDVFVNASRGEPFGTVVAEAFALGKAVIAGADGGLPEVVQHEQSGLLVEPEQPPRLASAIRRLLDGEDFRKSLERGALARAPWFSEERMAEQFDELVRDVSGKRP